jgi:D-cysteine desulfhydrase
MAMRPEARLERSAPHEGSAPFRYPPSVPLARTPTPVERLERLSKVLGVTIDVKRDDLSGLALTGNKVRKLELLLAAALDARCDTVITCGGLQSNHARATAVAAAKLGLDAHLVLRAESPPAAAEGNLFLARLAGATVKYISRTEWPRRSQIMHAEAERLLASEQRRSYVIPEGGSNALGAFGYIRCAEEIASHEERTGETYDLVVCATGSGGTQAGLIAGKALLGRPWRVLGFAVCDSATYFRAQVEQILLDLTTHYSLRLPGAEDAFFCNDAYIGPGYSLAYPALLEAIREVAETEGLFLDPSYTGKAFYGLMTEARAGKIPQGARVLFVHTGGIYGLLARARELELATQGTP